MPAWLFPRPRRGVTFLARAPCCRSSAERRSRPAGWRTWMCAIKKVTQETRGHPRAGAVRRCPVLVGESGDGAELAALERRRLFAPDSPAVLGSLQGGPNTAASPRMTAPGGAKPCLAVLALAFPYPPPSDRAEHGLGSTAAARARKRREPAVGPIPGRRCSSQPTRTQQKTRPKPGFLHDQTTTGNQSPCCFCRCSQRSWASMVRSAVRRASRRSRPISSPVSTQ